MDALRAAVPLSRLFLALADSERLSEVRVRARSRTASRAASTAAASCRSTASMASPWVTHCCVLGGLDRGSP